MEVTEAGRMTDVSEVQPEKALLPISRRASGKMREDKAVQALQRPEGILKMR
jgi:hypothetical protein